jgi:hypothetical protein
MHLRVPSGTFIPSVAVRICACKMDVAGVRNDKTVARTVRWRRLFISVFLLLRRVDRIEEHSQAT